MTKLNEDSKERTNCIQPDLRADSTPDPVQPDLRANTEPNTVQPDLRANPTPDHVQPDLRANSPIDFFQPETRATSPTPGTQTEQYYAVDIYVNFSHQISRTLERIQFILNESKIQKCTSVKIAEIFMTLEQNKKSPNQSQTSQLCRVGPGSQPPPPVQAKGRGHQREVQ